MSHNGNRKRVVIASDLHGSNACFRKVVALACEVNADAIALAGDLTGKELYSLTSVNGHYLYRTSEGTEGSFAADSLASMRRMWGDRGIYSMVAEADAAEPDAEIIEMAKVRRLVQWLEHAEKGLSPRAIELFIIPGNDDSPAIVSALERAPECVRLVDERIVEFYDYQITGLGYSNPTPWHTYRELSEAELEAKLEQLAAGIDDLSCTLLLVHVPPFGSGLDLAPELKEHSDGTLEVIPGGHREVGSRAVRKFVLERKPLLVASGHCHDSPGFRQMGRTLCLNPGSSYQSGTLNAALVILESGRVLGHQALIR